MKNKQIGRKMRPLSLLLCGVLAAGPVLADAFEDYLDCITQCACTRELADQECDEESNGYQNAAGDHFILAVGVQQEVREAAIEVCDYAKGVAVGAAAQTRDAAKIVCESNFLTDIGLALAEPDPVLSYAMEIAAELARQSCNAAADNAYSAAELAATNVRDDCAADAQAKYEMKEAKLLSELLAELAGIEVGNRACKAAAADAEDACNDTCATLHGGS